MRIECGNIGRQFGGRQRKIAGHADKGANTDDLAVADTAGLGVADDPALVNSDPEGQGWFFKLRLDNPGELDGLMDEGAYRDWVKTL